MPPPYATPLTPQAMDLVFQEATIAMLGIAATDPARYAQVRVDWQTGGQPAWPIDQDVCFVRETEMDDQYNRIREFTYLLNAAAPGTTAVETTSYTRVWGVFWTLYGPRCYDRARQIRSSLFTQATRDVFRAANLYLVGDVPAPRYAKELFEARWWARVDMTCEYNELVIEAPIVGTADSVEIVIENVNGVQRDFIVT